MQIRITRGRALLGTATFAVVTAVASVAWACVPSVDVNNNFTVKNGPCSTGSNVSTISNGDTLRACGKNIENKDWNYWVKLYIGDHFDQTTNDLRRRCGDLGILQTTAKTDNVGWKMNKFDQQFTLNAPIQGPAHFCALPLWNKEGGDAAGFLGAWPVSKCCSSEFYIYDNAATLSVI